jgi:hypothetical protein
MIQAYGIFYVLSGNAQEVTICLIIAVAQERGLPLPTFQAALHSAIKRNPDGIGLAWPDDGKVRVLKHPRNYAPVIDQASALYAATEAPFFIHLRYNTVGNTTVANTHPFSLTPALAMAHNKTLKIEPPNHSWSDSRTVAELLKTMIAGDGNFFNSALFWSFIEHQAGKDNRFVFLDAEDEELVIVNEHLGVEVDGLWFSNLYAWDPGTVGLPQRSYAFMDRAYEHEQDVEDIDGWDPRWNCEDNPLAWGFDRLDRRKLEAAVERSR